MFALNLALSVSQGLAFIGESPSEPSRVLIVQTEVSTAAYAERIQKMLKATGQAPINENLFISGARYRLDDETGKNGLRDLSDAIESIKPKLLILDPFYTMHRGDENDASHVAPILTRLKELASIQMTACLLVHHQGKPGESNSSRSAGHCARGSSAFADVPDASLSLARKDDSAELRSEFRNLPPALRSASDSMESFGGSYGSPVASRIQLSQRKTFLRQSMLLQDFSAVTSTECSNRSSAVARRRQETASMNASN